MGCDLSAPQSITEIKAEIVQVIERHPSIKKIPSRAGSKLQVNQTVSSRLRRERVILKLRSDTTMPNDIKYFSSPPCVNFCKIIDKLYLTSYSGITEENIMNNDIKMIVNVTYETPLIDNMDVTSIRVPIDDVLDENIYPYFEIVIPIMEEVISRRHAIAVHCLVGKSRSASIVLAYLIKASNMTLEDAFKHLHRCRSIIHPNISFMKALMKWELKHLHRTTIELIDIDFSGVRLEIPDIIIRNYPKVYTSEVNAQLQYFGYDKEAREKLIKTGVQRTRSSLNLPSLAVKDLVCSSISDYGGQFFYKRFSSIANKLDT